jgi:plasmid maintenance system antidote protein VapI
MKKSTKKIVSKYGEALCLQALQMHNVKDMDSQGIGHALKIHTNTATALIEAGRAIT